MKNSPSRFSPLGLLLLFTPCTQAHDNLPANWCMDPNTVPVVTANFNFAPEALENYRRANPGLEVPEENCDPVINRSCGIVDEWHYANEMSMAFCGGGGGGESSMVKSAIESDHPAPFVSSPTDFNARDHHDAYRFRDGNLVGSCVICVSKLQPPTPDPVPQEPDKD